MGNNSGTLRPNVIGDLEGTTAFTAEEIRDYYKRFLSECEDGSMTLSLQDFKKIYTEFFPSGDANEFAEHVFRCFDVDGNGRLDFREFLTGLNVQLKGTLEEKLGWAFHLYDINNTGRISKRELLKLLKSIYSLKSGQLPKEDRVSPEQICDHIFTSADKDHDGYLSRQEFIDIAIKSKTVQALLKGTMTASSSVLVGVGFDRPGSPATGRRNRSGSTGSGGRERSGSGSGSFKKHIL